MTEEKTTAPASPAHRSHRTSWFSTRKASDADPSAKTTLGSDKNDGDVVLAMPEQQKPPDAVWFTELFRCAAAPSRSPMPPLRLPQFRHKTRGQHEFFEPPRRRRRRCRPGRTTRLPSYPRLLRPQPLMSLL